MFNASLKRDTPDRGAQCVGVATTMFPRRLLPLTKQLLATETPAAVGVLAISFVHVVKKLMCRHRENHGPDSMNAATALMASSSSVFATGAMILSLLDERCLPSRKSRRRCAT